MYTDQEFEFIDTLLRLSTDNTLTYSDMIMKYNLSYDMYNKLCTDINQTGYKLIITNGDNFTITTLGRHVANIGFKKYLENLKSDQEIDNKIKILTLDDLKKTDSRSKTAVFISVIAILVSIVIGILDYTKPEKSDNNVDNNRNNRQIQTDGTSQINHPQLKSDSISKIAIKVIPDSIKN